MDKPELGKPAELTEFGLEFERDSWSSFMVDSDDWLVDEPVLTAAVMAVFEVDLLVVRM